MDRKGQRPRAEEAQGTAIEAAEVAAALETLYADQLRPYGRILRKRLGERAQAAGARSVDVDIKRLRASCEACPWLLVRDEEGGDWSALFRGRPEAFVDVYSPQDPYPAELWRQAAAYFGSLDDASMVLPGGRYLCAQVLARRGLPFLAGRTLGEVCHIVQLAISQNKLLGYLNGAVVPYQRSQSMVKERCAERGRPCTSASQGKSALASWQTVRKCLLEILKDVAQGSGSIPLSNVKRLFRSRFHVELSETALGHAKLSELLQDPRLGGVCTVRLQGQGYVVAPAAPEPPARSQISLAEGIVPRPGAAASPGAPVGSGASSFRERARGIQPLSLDGDDGDTVGELPTAQAQAQPSSGAGGLPATPALLPVSTPSPCSTRYVARFLEAPAPAAAAAPPLVGMLSPNSIRKAQSLPRLLGRSGPPAGAGGAPFAAALPSKELCGAAGDFVGSKELCGAAGDLMGSKVGTAAAPVAAKHAQTPRGDEGAPAAAAAAKNGAVGPTAAGNGAREDASERRALAALALGHLGFSVQNTFIHVALPPPTPPAGASCRAHSLPRNMGSGQERCCFDATVAQSALQG